MRQGLPSQVWIGIGFVLIALAFAIAPGGAPIIAQEREALVTRGKALFMEKGCYGCHTIGAMGTPIAPDLSHARTKYAESDLARLLMNPSAQEPTRHMPNLGLSEPEARALAAYLGSLP